MIIWGFVDYENTGTLEGVPLGQYERLIVFCGPKNKKIKFGDIPSTDFCRIDIIGLKTSGANNLDFHMAYYLGKFSETAGKDVSFHIISNDTGFNGLVSHIKKTGRPCQRVACNKPPVPKPKQKSKQPALSKCSELVLASLNLIDGRTRPRTQASLTNWIKAHCQGIKNGAGPEKAFQELEAAHMISITDQGLKYQFHKQPKP